jgi:hypothetical protein
MRRERSRSTQKGWSIIDLRAFSTVEAILAASIFAMIVTAFVGAYLYGQEATALGGNRARAALLAEEGLEAARNIRDSGYANLADGTYGLAITGGQWMFSGAEDATGTFTRRVTVSSVDTRRKLVTSAVTWQQNAQRTGIVSLTTRLTNWMAQAAGSWINPFQESSFNAAGTNDGVHVATQGNYAYLVRNGGTNFMVFDVTNPAAPVLRGSLTLTGTTMDVAVSGNYAYVSNQDNTQELQVVDISNPDAPRVVGIYNAPGASNANGVAVVGSTVYLARASSVNDEFLVINASVPTAPTLIGSVDLGATAYDVAIVGNAAYVASGSNTQELQVIDISTPTAPRQIGSLNMPGNTDADAVAGFSGGVFVAQGTTIAAVNIATPSSPAYAGVYDAGGAVNDVAMGQDNAYVFLATAAAAAEFQVIDISTLTAPTLASSVNMAGANALNGIAYNAGLDRAFGASAANTMEFVGFAPQ